MSDQRLNFDQFAEILYGQTDDDPMTEALERTYWEIHRNMKFLYGDKIPDDYISFVKMLDTMVDRATEFHPDNPQRLQWLQDLDENLGDA